MLMEYAISSQNAITIFQQLVTDWHDTQKKVFAIRATEKIDNVKIFYESLFPILGSPACLAEDVTFGDRSHQRTGGLWMEVRYDSRFPDAYRHSPNAQPLHTDGSYISSFPNSTFLCCVSNAAIGGETTFINSNDVVNALQRENKALLEKLLTIKVLHERSGDTRNLPIISQKNGLYYVNWNYYCVSKNVSPDTKIIANEFHHFLLTSLTIKEATILIKLNPGDAVVWKDHEVLHGRNAFSPTKESERFIWKCALDVGVFA